MSDENSKATLGGRYTFASTDRSVNRIGYGAMRLTGPNIMGLPRDPDQAIAVLREAVERGVDHIDTSDYYGPHTVNELIRKALHPYPAHLTIVTKLGARRPPDGSWKAATSPQDLIDGVHANLRNLGVDALDIVNYRHMAERPTDGSIAEQISTLADVQRSGLIRHIGVSNVTPAQIAQARGIVEVVCVQNMYNLVARKDDALIDELAADGIAYVPFFPLGGFTPLQSAGLDAIALRLGATSMQVALAWLLARSPNILLIPGTSSLTHLRENLEAAQIELDAQALRELERLRA